MRKIFYPLKKSIQCIEAKIVNANKIGEKLGDSNMIKKTGQFHRGYTGKQSEPKEKKVVISRGKPLQLLYNSLKEGKSLSNEDIRLIETSDHTLPQLASLGVQLVFKKRNNYEEQLIKKFLENFPELSEYLLPLLKNKNCKEGFDKVSVLIKVKKGIELSDLEMEKLFGQYNKGEISDTYMATWLMLVCYKGLSEKNVLKLTNLMKDSGKVFDYRNSFELNYRKIIRRYPTGALSEKTALIMPSLIASLSEKYSVASNFLVAKTLSYTGGTWDKLNSLPNFYFPKQGKETLELMGRPPHVAMSVTKEDFNPLDRKLYQLRSATGTVESIPLIVSSIASKQLAMPADFLLMDVRYGQGAFLKSKKEALEMSYLLMKILKKNMHSEYILTDSQQPTGMSIGNEVEIVEAIKIMKDDKEKNVSELWDSRAISEQKNLVVEMLAKMLFHVFPSLSLYQYRREINNSFLTGKVVDSFKKILLNHKVEKKFVNELISNPELLIDRYSFFNILSKRRGKVSSIDQKRLGMFVNFELQTGLNEYVLVKKNGGGIILKVRVGDNVVSGDCLCVVLATSDYIEKNTFFLESYLTEVFEIN